MAAIKKKAQKEETTTQKLYSHLYECCNILRGPINRDEFKSYITPLLFFKRISDVYDEEYRIALEVSEGDAEYAKFDENYLFQIPEGCHWKDVREKSENIGSAIVSAMVGIERANPNQLHGVFSSFDDANWTDKNKLSDERLKNLIEHLSKIRVGNDDYSADVMGDSYEFLIKKFADLSKKNAGEFYTPRSIVKLLVMLLNPKEGDTVYDPACGTGGMLIESIRHIKDQRRAYGKMYGQENKLETSSIARMNLFLHGAKDFNIVQGDTLRNPGFISEGKLQTFDCVIANPPFSSKKWGEDSFSSDKYGRNLWGCPKDSNGDYAWLQHMVKSMNPDTGRCAVILSQGVLTRGNIEGEIRKKLVESDLLECVITLPTGVFYKTGVSACILLLNNNKPSSHRGHVCLIDGTDIYTPTLSQNVLSEENIQTLYQLYTSYEDVVERSKIVTLDDIRKKEYSLLVKSYIERKPQEITPYAEVKEAYFQALADVQEAESKMKKLLIEGGYVHE